MFVLPLSRSVTYPASAAPFGRALERLLDAPLDRYFGGSPGGTRTPALDVRETDASYLLAFDVPGVTREQLKVSIEGRRVSIESVDVNDAVAPKLDTAAADAAANPAAPADAERVLYRERSTARYARTVSLPAEVDQSASQARFENGVLTLALAKKQPRGATQLNIS